MSETFNKAKRYTKRPGQYTTQGLLLFLLPLPLLLAVMVSLATGTLSGVLANTVAIGLFLIGAVSTRRGIKNEKQYLAKKVALAPKLPYKLFGGLVVAMATFIAAFIGAGHSVAIAVCFALGALLGFYLAYGFDPRSEKGASTGFGYSAEEVVAALEEAEGRLARIEQAGADIRNKELSDRLDRIVLQSRKILKIIEDDPRDLRRARKFLNTYLEGAEKVTQGYAKTHGYADSEQLQDNFRNVLITIEEVFNEQHDKLLENDVLDLDVQIEVLAMQLKREGVI